MVSKLKDITLHKVKYGLLVNTWANISVCNNLQCSNEHVMEVLNY
jgi:hypothetical protein